MRRTGDGLILSATDLTQFLCCPFGTALEMAAVAGERKKPHWHDPLLDILIERGRAHEKAYVDSLGAPGTSVVDLADVRTPDEAVRRTLEAMRSGVDAVSQGALQVGRWYGRPDVLAKVEGPSVFGAWSYEVADTKLARETAAGTILQLGLYGELLEAVQGVRPRAFRVVTPDPESPTAKRRVLEFRSDDFGAYVRWVRGQMESAVAAGQAALEAANYPEPVDRCDVCAWSAECSAKRHADDHLSIVAGITALQRRELQAQDVPTLTALARLDVPLPFKPRRGSKEAYVKARDQARVQLESRGRERPLVERREVEAGRGLARLPEPSPGDVFLDLEGDAFAREGGREYLFGIVTIAADGTPAYRPFWAFTDGDECAAFEAVIDSIDAAWKAHEGMHVYHYAPYEPAAFRRLMGRYATRADELDRLLRGGRFVDLYGVVRQGLFAGVERYSIKNLEPLYDFTRAVPLREASRALRTMEHALESSCPEVAPPDVRSRVEGYNRDDCVSTLRLRDWLEGQRQELLDAGVAVPRPELRDDEPSERVDERARRVEALRGRLLEGVPVDRALRSDEQQARWLLAYLLDWHRREDKATWWEYFRLKELPEEELYDEDRALAGLAFVRRVQVVTNAKTGKPTGSVVDRYVYPPQEMEIRAGHELKGPDGRKWGEVVRVDRDARTIEVKKGKAKAEVHESAVFEHTYVSTEVQEDEIARFAESVIDRGGVSEAASTNRAAHRLLLATTPRLRSSAFAPLSDEPAVDFAVRIANDLDATVLPIQGPPGSGKTYCGSRMIVALVRAGKKVGVTATSHKVIRNLLEAVAEAAVDEGTAVRLGHKGDGEDADASSPIRELRGNEETLEALRSGDVRVLGGTAWLWARPEFAGAVDVLFVDEAGQMSLANVLAVSGAADSVVLLGDPQQLDQPQKGSHPDGVNASALGHILGSHQTISADRGLFLPTTWRMAPSLCAFTSELFYEGKLRSREGLERQAVVGVPGLEGSGLVLVPVAHDGNRNASDEEVEAVASLVARLLAPGARWTNDRGEATALRGEDVLVVAPYNAQVSRLAERLATTGARVGTVDKFQGQQAPVVVYSMATSSPEDAPRGMEFLYSLNRLNVATSRAKCLAIVVASPRLFEPQCRSPRQMQLANALCRYREMARVIA
ncbi:MAG: TM0106 family RecB-like putative nuclease [Vicinamibacteria bacterium]